MSKNTLGTKLSLCMIVKNEGRFLRDCLNSIKKIVDQIIIVDTGSEDETLKIANEFNAEIYHFDWCNNFSAARNESIRHANGDWILWMDGDEHLRAESVYPLTTLLTKENKPVAYRIHIRNKMRGGDYSSLSSAHRLFTNGKGIYFSGRIHEQISGSLAKLRGEERTSNVYLEHEGYALMPEEQKKKNVRNRKLLEMMVKEAPENAYAHFTLAQHYSLTDRFEEALNHYKKAIKLKQFDSYMTASLYNTTAETLIKQGHMNQAKDLCTQSIRLVPVQVGGYYLLYKIAERNSDYTQALHWLKILYMNNKKVDSSGKRISTDVYIEEEMLLLTLVNLHEKSGQFTQAINYMQKIQKLGNNSSEISAKIVNLYLRIPDYPMAEKFLKQMIQAEPENLSYQKLLGTIMIKQLKMFDAVRIFESVLQCTPSDSDTVKKLVGLYAKTGQRKKAEELLIWLRPVLNESK